MDPEHLKMVDGMRVYLATSIRGAGRNLDLARAVIHHLRRRGHEVINAQVFLPDSSNDDLTDEEVFERDMGYLAKADLLIADVTYPSLGVGYEICKALDMGKRVVAFFKRGTRLSKLIAGNPSIQLMEFTDEEELMQKISTML